MRNIPGWAWFFWLPGALILTVGTDGVEGAVWFVSALLCFVLVELCAIRDALLAQEKAGD